MANLPKKAGERITAGLKKFQPILAAAKTRDINESDTVVIVTDMLQEIFGYDKYSEITSEHMIRGTFCDLAVKLDGAVQFLIEVKAIGLELKDQFVKQAIDYASNKGVEWVALTNGIEWRVFRVTFAKPIDFEVVVDLDFATLNHRSDDDIDLLGLLSKEGWQKARIGDYYHQRQALSRFTLGALIVSDPVLEVIRREIRRISPGVKIETSEVRTAIEADVLKRDVIDGDKANLARRQVNRVAGRTRRATKSGDAISCIDGAEAPSTGDMCDSTGPSA